MPRTPHSSIGNGLHVPKSVRIRVAGVLITHRGLPSGPAHRYSGSDSERAGVGLPGHCDPCAIFGHVVAHPDFGCADVQCNNDHADDPHRSCDQCAGTGWVAVAGRNLGALAGFHTLAECQACNPSGAIAAPADASRLMNELVVPRDIVALLDEYGQAMRLAGDGEDAASADFLRQAMHLRGQMIDKLIEAFKR